MFGNSWNMEYFLKLKGSLQKVFGRNSAQTNFDPFSFVSLFFQCLSVSPFICFYSSSFPFFCSLLILLLIYQKPFISTTSLTKLQLLQSCIGLSPNFLLLFFPLIYNQPPRLHTIMPTWHIFYHISQIFNVVSHINILLTLLKFEIIALH